MSETGEPTIEFSKKPFLELPTCPPTDEVLLVSNTEILAHIEELTEKYEYEIRDSRHIVYDHETNRFMLVYSNPDGTTEHKSFAEEPEVALLTLIQELVEGTPDLNNRASVVNDYWEISKQNPELEAMHARLKLDRIEALVLRSFMEQVASLPPYLRTQGTLLANEKLKLLTENQAILERLELNDISELEAKFIEDLQQDEEEQAFNAFISPIDNNAKKDREEDKSYGRSLVAGVLVLSFVAGSFAACSQLSTGDGVKNSAPTLPPIPTELTTTTLPETTTTLLQDCKKMWTVEDGDSLFSIAEFCGITIESILAANPIIVDRNKIAIGQLLLMPNAETPYTLPPTTTTAPATTTTAKPVPPTTQKPAPPTTAKPAPQTTAAPTVPPSTVPKVHIDGTLSDAECKKLYGDLVSFGPNKPTLFERLKQRKYKGGYLTPQDATVLVRYTNMPKDFKLEHVGYAEDECVPNGLIPLYLDAYYKTHVRQP